MTNNFAARAANVVLTLSLGLWVGAMAGFAFFFAPPAFAAMGATPQFAAMIATIMVHLTDFGFVCAGLSWVAALVIMRVRVTRALIAIVSLVALMTALSWAETAFIVPQMKVTAVRTHAYAGLHKRSSTMYGAVLILGVIALALAAARRD